MPILVAGNWKMNGTRASITELDALRDGLGNAAADVALCPPATLVAAFAERAAGSPMAIGGQDCHAAEAGAHTGDISAEMLADAGARLVILGHSERRTDHRETDMQVRDKTRAAWRAGLSAIVCVGETEDERSAGLAAAVVERQLAASLPDGGRPSTLSVAYEPIWAIGTGRTPTTAEIADIHAAIRAILISRLGQDDGAAVRILYGGSVKPTNAAEIFAVPNVDGALVGGASLKAADLLAIVAAAG